MGLVLALLMLGAQEPSASASPVTATVEYEVGAEDILKVTVFGHEDLSLNVIVQPDGMFLFPLIGRVKANGLTTRELEQKLALLLSQGFIRNPQVSVSVHEYRSKTIHVVGEVSRPGSYPLSESRTLVEVLSRAGPLLPGAGAEIVVIHPATPSQGPLLPQDVEGRAGDPQRPAAQVTRVDLRRLQAGEMVQNVALRPGDTVFVPQAPRVFVTGEVRNPGAYAFMPGMTVRQAVSLAGGFTEHASTGRLKVVRQAGGKAREIKLKIDDVVEPGDTVVVKESWF